MNTATENLENDHVHIIRLTEIMNRMIVSGKPDPSHIGSVIDIIRNFADGIHHAKEEGLLFKSLEEKGFSLVQGPVAVMLHEHIEGRKYVRGIEENLELYRNGSVTALEEIFSNMSGYAELLQNHISKEDNILFRMADRVLSPAEQEKLLLKFGSEEEERPEGQRSADYIEAIEKLAALYPEKNK